MWNRNRSWALVLAFLAMSGFSACSDKKQTTPPTFNPVVTGDQAVPDGGMWPLNMVSKEKIQNDFGFTLTDEFLKNAQLAALKTDHGTASFVSSRGLVMTNAHVAAGDVSEYDNENKTNYLNDGFVAHWNQEEVKLPDFKLYQLLAMEDVTEKINSVVTPGMSDQEAEAAKKAKIVEMQATTDASSKLEVVTFFHGLKYQLYTYKVYTDNRLVFFPEWKAAFFGDQDDNFNYPRQNYDVAFVRAYENGQPVSSTHHFSWSTAGATKDDLSFVIGNPGGTERHLTSSSLDFINKHKNDLRLKLFTTWRDAHRNYIQTNPDREPVLKDAIFYYENFMLVWGGQQANFATSTLIADRAQADQQLVQYALNQNMADAAQFLDKISLVDQERSKLYRESILLDRGMSRAPNEQPDAFRGSQGLGLYGTARNIVRLVLQKALPVDQRLPGFDDAAIEKSIKGLSTEKKFEKPLEKVMMLASLKLALAELGADHPTLLLALNNQTAEDFVNTAIDQTKIDTLEYRKELLSGGVAAITASQDPLIQSALRIEDAAVKLRRRLIESDAQLNSAYRLRDSLVLASSPKDTVYPDATFTLRFHLGKVRGYEEAGKFLDYFMPVSGMFEKSAKAENKYPFELPKKWVEAKEKGQLDMSLPFNFVSTNDIIGGNSGSAVVNGKLEVIGLAFDGNRVSVINEHTFQSGNARCISVHSEAIRSILKQVYGAPEIASELGQ